MKISAVSAESILRKVEHGVLWEVLKFTDKEGNQWCTIYRAGKRHTRLDEIDDESISKAVDDAIAKEEMEAMENPDSEGNIYFIIG